MATRRRFGFQLLFPLVWALSFGCDAPSVQSIPPEIISLKTNSVVRGKLSKGETLGYHLKISAGQDYLACIMAVTALPLEVHIQDSALNDLGGWAYVDWSPETIAFSAQAGYLYDLATIWVNADRIAADSASYSLLVLPTPPFGPMKRDGSSTSPLYVAPGQVTLGCVPSRSTSYYYSDGLEPGAAHSISICPVQNYVSMRVYPAPGFHGAPLPCSESQSDRECTSVAVSPVYFAVDSSPVDRIGAYYLIYVQ